MSANEVLPRSLILEQLVQATQEGFWYIDPDTLTLDVNPAMCAILGRPREEIIGRSIYDFVDEANTEIFRQEIAARARGAQGSYEISLLRPDGTNVPCLNNATPVYDDEGRKVASIGLWKDITQLKQVETALQAAHDQLEQRVEERTSELLTITDNLPTLIVHVDMQQRYRFANKTCREWYARTPEQILGKSINDVLGGAFEKLKPYVEQALQGEPATFEETLTYPDGITRTVRGSYVPQLGLDGSVQGYYSMVADVSEMKRAEEQLRQAQKMEAVGQLTGGVAHDFNNLLAVIMGNAELLEGRAGSDDRKLGTILRAARRGAELTHRLLAFSRRQPLQPRVMDLGVLVSGMSELLARTLGETIDIGISEAPGVWEATADPGQVENALLNLALNARDAMPRGGRLTIECENVQLDEIYVAANPEATAGDFVGLSVSDTGTGMSAEVRAQAFNPFFTTKGVGEGSGLGLSMVFGFAKQSGGHVTIYSEQGLGTTVNLYLPRAESTAPWKEVRRERDIPRGRGETILVIEDDPDVRTLAVEMLEGLGYQVVDVPHAAAAHETLADGKVVDLVLSDVVLPGGTSGPEFAEQVHGSNPDLRVIFMSGYPAVAAMGGGFLDAGKVLLNKPFQTEKLATAVREALG